MKILKQNKGFSLLEVIISITTLAITSGFILQMFMVSSNVNAKAQAVDIATAEAISAIENFKMQDSVESFLESSWVESCEVMSGFSNAVGILRFYDEDWQLIQATGNNLDFPEDTQYCLTMEIEPLYEKLSLESVSTGQLYSVSAEVIDIKANEDKRYLSAIAAKKYFV